MGDTEGPVEIVSSRGDREEDRKVELIVREMRRYNVKMTALGDGATEQFQHVYSWVGNLGIRCTVSCYAPIRAASRQEF